MINRTAWLKTCLGSALVCALALASSAARAAAGDLTLVASPALEEAVTEVAAAFTKETGMPVALEFPAPHRLKSRMTSGESPDVVLLDQGSIDALASADRIAQDSRAAVGRVGLGVAVAAGKTLDLAGPDKLRQALAQAKAVAVPATDDALWSSPVITLVGELGLGQAAGAKWIAGSGRNPLSAVGFGEADLGLHSIVTIRKSKGLELAAPVPGALQRWVRFDVAIAQEAPNESDAQRLATFLKGPAAGAILLRWGVEVPAN